MGRIFRFEGPCEPRAKIMSSSRTIECVYEGGVLRPLHEVDFKEGERLKLTVKKFEISKFYGALGEGSMEEFEAFEEEAQMKKGDLSRYYGILGKASAERLAELEGSNDCALQSREMTIENSRTSVRRTRGLIKLDPDIAKDIADSD
jgi:predicted DNA-binding antitoxin AbrB/MazE fold protein